MATQPEMQQHRPLDQITRDIAKARENILLEERKIDRLCAELDDLARAASKLATENTVNAAVTGKSSGGTASSMERVVYSD